MCTSKFLYKTSITRFALFSLVSQAKSTVLIILCEISNLAELTVALAIVANIDSFKCLAIFSYSFKVVVTENIYKYKKWKPREQQ